LRRAKWPIFASPPLPPHHFVVAVALLPRLLGGLFLGRTRDFTSGFFSLFERADPMNSFLPCFDGVGLILRSSRLASDILFVLLSPPRRVLKMPLILCLRLTMSCPSFFRNSFSSGTFLYSSFSSCHFFFLLPGHSIVPLG